MSARTWIGALALLGGGTLVGCAQPGGDPSGGGQTVLSSSGAPLPAPGTAGSAPGGPGPNGAAGAVAGGGALPTAGAFAPTLPAGGSGGNDALPAAGGGALAGTGGVAGAGGSVGAGSGAAGGDPSDTRPPCLANQSEAVIIGDSYINWSTHTLPADLVAESGQTWRLYAIGGASMASGGIATLVPDQFEQAYAEDPNITFVLMDGGGNDIMIPDATWIGGAECKNRMDSATVQVCRDIIDFALEKAELGMQRMADVGVKDVLYFFYPEVPEGTILGGLYPNAMLEYGSPLAKQLCESAETRTAGHLRCHFVDMKPVFAGHNPDWFFPTDIHPNEMGSAAMAAAIWQRMQDECIGQPASSGCCAP